jgi:hypothetical protein|tara:strand:- start:1645 stop:1791 length:147 start_codon:yes stop_codon:yes gene_type:complete
MAEKLETISLRGKKKLWLEFVYTTKKRGEKNTWSVLSKLIQNYIKKQK